MVRTAAVDRSPEVAWVQPGNRLGFERWSGWQQWIGDEEMAWVQPGNRLGFERWSGWQQWIGVMKWGGFSQETVLDLKGGQGGSSG